MLQRIILISLLLLSAAGIHAQNTTSPYSILGIGDIDTKDYGKFFGMASTSIGMRSASYINLNNPASITSLDPNMLNIDVNGRWRNSSFQYPIGDSFSTSYRDAQFERMSLTFRPTKAYGFSFGLKPFSTVNYSLGESLSLQNVGVTSISKNVVGSGGMNQVYLANAVQLNKNFSIGLTSSFLFGSMTTSTAYQYSDLGININRTEYQALKGFQFQGGFQYTGKINDHISQTLGLTVSNASTLKGNFTSQYAENDTTITSTTTTAKNFKIPLQWGVGYSVIVNQTVTVAADYQHWNWAQQKLDYPGAYTHDAQRYSMGFQYAPYKNIQGQMREKISLQAGVFYEQTYLAINNNQLEDKGVTVGLASNLTRLINVYLGLEVGNKGNVSDGQIKENYTQISFGVTLKEFWYNTKKLRLYQ